MEQRYIYLNTAKRQKGFYSQQVELAIAGKAFERIYFLKMEIGIVISDLRESENFFKSIGEAHEVDLFIIFYTTLLYRLNSS